MSISMQCLFWTTRWRKGAHQYFIRSHLRSFFPTSGLFALSSHFLGSFFGIRLTVKRFIGLLLLLRSIMFSILHGHHLQILSLCLKRTNIFIYSPWETFVLKCLSKWIKTAQLNQPIRSRSKYSPHTHLKKILNP